MSGVSIKKIWEWVKTMVFKLLRRPGHEPASHVMTPLEKKLARRIQKRQAREGRGIDTRQGGPNMPRYQPCHGGHGWKRRKRKTMGGAYYGCKKCGDFFVRASG